MSEIAQTVETSSEEAQVRLRSEKAEELRKQGIDPWGNGQVIPNTTAEVKNTHGAQTAEQLVGERPTYIVAGRVTELRRLGKISFLRVLDRSESVGLQIMIRKDASGFKLIEDTLLDRGDIVRAVGVPIRTKTGELSLECSELTVLTKALRPLPEKWHGLADVETRYRHRYVDLFTTPGVRDTFLKRAKLVSAIRLFLDRRGFVEVETPVLHDVAGGATARPFRTHHNALDLPLQLRIATELHLKRLVVGGIERVYEIGRIFRNEGIDRRHNPEFTMIEFYQAHATYHDLMELTEALVAETANEVAGATKITYQGQPIDLTPPYPRTSMIDSVGRHFAAANWGIVTPESPDASKWLDAMAPFARQMAAACLYMYEHPQWPQAIPELSTCRNIADSRTASPAFLPKTLGNAVASAFELVCEKDLPKDRPTFVTDFPIEISPLARKRNTDGRIVDRFELYVAGMEVANAFSELNDPADQRKRFEAQVEAARMGDQEAMPYDEDYVRALEHGMPPTAGEGIGIDRLCMLLTDSASIRDVILFPLLRPEAVKAGTTSPGEG